MDIKQFNEFCLKYKINILKQYDLDFKLSNLLYFAVETNKNKLIQELNDNQMILPLEEFHQNIQAGIRMILNSNFYKPKNLSTLKILTNIQNVNKEWYGHAIDNIVARSVDASELKTLEFIKNFAVGAAGINPRNYWYIVAHKAIQNNNLALTQAVLDKIQHRKYNITISHKKSGISFDKDLLEGAGVSNPSIFNLLWNRFIINNNYLKDNIENLPIANTIYNKDKTNLHKCLTTYKNLLNQLNDTEKSISINQFQNFLKYKCFKSSTPEYKLETDFLLILKDYGFNFYDLAYSKINYMLKNEKYDFAYDFIVKYNFETYSNFNAWNSSLLEILLPKNDIELFKRFELLKKNDTLFAKPSDVINKLSTLKLFETELSSYIIQQFDKPLLEASLQSMTPNTYAHAYITGEIFKKSMSLDNYKAKRNKI